MNTTLHSSHVAGSRLPWASHPIPLCFAVSLLTEVHPTTSSLDRPLAHDAHFQQSHRLPASALQRWTLPSIVDALGTVADRPIRLPPNGSFSALSHLGKGGLETCKRVQQTQTANLGPMASPPKPWAGASQSMSSRRSSTHPRSVPPTPQGTSKSVCLLAAGPSPIPNPYYY